MKRSAKRGALRASARRDQASFGSRRRAGVLLHPSSLDGPDPIGDIGPSTHRFLRWLASAGFTSWQMLPIGPVGEGNSPYSSRSSFAGEPMLLSLDAMVEEGWLPRRRLEQARRAAPRTSGWAAARRSKLPLLLEAYEGFLARRGAHRADYLRFLEDSYRPPTRWLWHWLTCDTSVKSLGATAFLQYAFDLQWSALRRTARELGIELIGDLPIFVAPDSADVVANPELFRLDRQRRPSIVTGVPPDLFSKNGQLWGHPHYRWSAHRRDGFRWWRERVRAALDRFDSLRIDHFVGFVHAFEIPAAHRTAKHGRWRPTPGRELLAALRREFGELPFIAEDLGAVTAEVVRLRDEFGLPGMRLLQNAFGGGDSLDLPHRHPEHCVVYPGTHDNDTIAGWWRTLDAASRRRALDYAGGSSREIVSSLLRLALTSPANLCVIPMQDLLALGSQARMNKPWQSRGQWEWRLPANWLTRIDAAAWKRRIDAARRSPRHA